MLLRKLKSHLSWGILAAGMLVALLVALLVSPGNLLADGGSWTGTYWNNRNLQGSPVLVRQDAAIDFDWEGLSPDSAVNVDNFSARWVRTYNFAAGTYTFKATMDDGMRAWIDGKLIIDDWQDGKERTVEATVNLGNGPHEITVEYYEFGGKAVAGFTWAPVSGQPGNPPPPSKPVPPMGPGPGGPPHGGTGGPSMPPPSGDVIYPVGEVKSPYLNVRRGPGTSHDVLAVLQQNTEVYIIGRSSGSTWYLVRTYGGLTGWVKRYYIHSDFPYTSLPFAEHMQQPEQKPPSEPPHTYPAGTVNTGFLNVRLGPGINYRPVAVVSSGTQVALLGRSQGGNWLLIRIPTGSTGWVNGYYIATNYPTQNLPVK